MKTFRIPTLFVLAFLAVLLFVYPAIAETPKHYTDLKFSPPPEVRIPKHTRFQLQNGIIVYLMEDHELPLVRGTALVRTGDRFEPANQVGLAELTGAVMRSGGTQKRSADQLNQLLEQRAAAIETAISTTQGSASFNTLLEDLPEVFSLFAEVIQQPAFAPDQFAIAKVQLQGGIARRNDDPDDILGREFQKLIYGSDSPYARTVEYSTLNNITRDDLIQFYQRSFRPNQMLLGIVGDFDSKQMRAMIESKFGAWKPAGQAIATQLPSVTQAKQGGIFFINQPQLNQSYLAIGHLGGQLNNPDYPALTVMEDVLGGSGFGRRLFNEVRTRQGLAYTVGADWNAEYDRPGTFLAYGTTRSDATVPFIRSVLSEIDRIRKEPVSADELKVAKDSVLNSFIFSFQAPVQTLSRLLIYDYFGYPADFIFQYRKAVEATTIADVQRVAQKYLQPDKLVTLVVGNEKEIQPSLSTLGQPVTAVDITIPKASQS